MRSGETTMAAAGWTAVSRPHYGLRTRLFDPGRLPAWSIRNGRVPPGFRKARPWRQRWTGAWSLGRQVKAVGWLFSTWGIDRSPWRRSAPSGDFGVVSTGQIRRQVSPRRVAAAHQGRAETDRATPAGMVVNTCRSFRCAAPNGSCCRRLQDFARPRPPATTISQ